MTTAPIQQEVATPHGHARVHLYAADGTADGGSAPRAVLLLGHGAGGGIGAPDLIAICCVANRHGLLVALVEQPYRVAGRRAPAPASHLDASWLAIVKHLRAGDLGGLPLITGGRSSGARVACRTAQRTASTAVLCLAFPLLPPGRPGVTRLAELDDLDLAGLPVLVVQGANDRFGTPPGAQNRTVVVVGGDHSLKQDLPAVEHAVAGWLMDLLGPSHEDAGRP